ncbi:carboxypeptidase-like regulatory domain-containing protein [Nemorincola caseinilytica]|uniref:Carboxypeptidase-like regulatory domain-containing protein n=1 Tax=Nemorincola caseinilytica TaxID=2054315 RepID=A0ABP8N522_9BACT
MHTLKHFILFLVLLLATGVHAQTTQNITGRVFDEASKQPLTGAVIVLLNSATTTGAVSDADGNFLLPGVPLGRQTLKVSYTGYEDRIMNDVLVTAGKEVNLNINMQEALHTLADVKVTYNKNRDKTRTNNDMSQVSARSFNVDETKRYAGALGDPSRMAANFAGVVSGNDSRNDIVVRGNSPTGMLWQLEGLNIPNPNHYGSLSTTGGPISMLNNNNIDKSDFLTSAFPAQYGNAVAGVFDMKLRDGNRNKKEFVAQIGFNGFELGAEGPLGKNKRTSYVANYRYSTLGVFQKMGINFGAGSAVPLYQDLNFKVVSNISKRSKVTFFGVSGNSRIDFMGKDVDTTKAEQYSGDPYSNERNKFGMSVTGLAYEYQLSEKTSTKLTLGYGYTMQKYVVDSLSPDDLRAIPDQDGKFTTSKLSGVWTVTHKMNAKNNMQAGLTYDHLGFDLVNTDILPDGTKAPYIDRSGSYGLAQGFVQWKHRFSDKLSSVAGVHGQYVTFNSTIAAEPRASLRYALGKRQAVSVGYGMHHQAQNVYTYFYETRNANGVFLTNKDLGLTRSHHSVVTYDWNINDNLRVKAEGYYQILGNVPVEQRSSSFSLLNTGADFGYTDVDSLVNKGKGKNYGAELTVERFFNKGYYFLVTGSLFNSSYRGSDGIERNTAFNTGHVLNVLAGKEFKVGKGNVLALNLKLTSVGGRYFTPVDQVRSQQEGHTVYMDNIAFSQKQPDYFRTDLRVSYRKEYRKSTLELAVDLQNLTNHQNILERYYDVKANKTVTVYQQSFFPIPTIRYTF